MVYFWSTPNGYKYLYMQFCLSTNSDLVDQPLKIAAPSQINDFVFLTRVFFRLRKTPKSLRKLQTKQRAFDIVRDLANEQ